MASFTSKTSFTFKKEPAETGLASVGNPHPDTQIKLNKRRVGCISAPSWSTKDNKWGIKFTVTKETTWGWVTIKHRFDDEPSARQWIKDHASQILEKLDLHFLDD